MSVLSGGCLRSLTSLEETRQFNRPASPAPGDISELARVVGRRHSCCSLRSATGWCVGKVGLKSLYNFALLGPQNYETNLSSFVADQLLDFSGFIVVCTDSFVGPTLPVRRFLLAGFR